MTTNATFRNDVNELEKLAQKLEDLVRAGKISASNALKIYEREAMKIW